MLRFLCVILFWAISATVFAETFYTTDPTNNRILKNNRVPIEIVGVNRFAIYEYQDNFNDLTPDQMFARLQKYGINTIRVFIREGYVKEGNRPDVPPMEPKLGTYSKYHLDELDNVFKLANKYKMYVILCLFDHYYLRHSWVDQLNPKSKVPVKVRTPYYEKGFKSDRFYTSPLTRPFQEKRIRMLVKRYKNEPYLLAWEPMNEVNGVLDNSYVEEDADVVAWAKVMTGIIKDIDPNHLVTISTTGDLFWSKGQFKPWKTLNTLPDVDIVQIHSYSVDRAPKAARQLIEFYIKSYQKFGKVVMLGEFAPLAKTPKRNEVIREVILGAKSLKTPALLWSHRYDNYGPLDDAVLQIYKDIY